MNNGLWLKQRRQELGLSQDELAARLQSRGVNVTRAAISHWENDRNDSPLQSAQVIRVLAQALDLRVSDLIDDNTESESEAARSAASIVDHLPPDGQRLALDHLRVLQRHFSRQ